MYSAQSTFRASRLGHSGSAARGGGHGVVARGSIARRFGLALARRPGNSGRRRRRQRRASAARQIAH